MKIYIVGSVASGKSTLARRMARATGIPCHHLDEVVYGEDPADSRGNRKRSIQERDALFFSILAREHYIMEDTGRTCFVEGMRQAEVIVHLEIPLYVCRQRILCRWIKQNLGLEKCTYKPRFIMLRRMFKWAKDYDTGVDGIKTRVALYPSKTVVLRNNKEIERYLMSLT